MVWTTRRGLYYWEPREELDRLQREMNRLFGRATGERSRAPDEFPAVNVWAGADNAILTAELPGVDAAALEITVKNDTVTIRGNRQPEALKEGEAYLRQERGTGSFARSLSLPFKVQSDKVTAQYRTGILQVILPRAEEDKPKRIAVNAE